MVLFFFSVWSNVHWKVTQHQSALLALIKPINLSLLNSRTLWCINNNQALLAWVSLVEWKHTGRTHIHAKRVVLPHCTPVLFFFHFTTPRTRWLQVLNKHTMSHALATRPGQTPHGLTTKHTCRRPVLVCRAPLTTCESLCDPLFTPWLTHLTRPQLQPSVHLHELIKLAHS